MTEIMTTLTLIFTVATAALLLSRKLNQPPIPLYIISGLLLTPYISFDQVLQLSQVGIGFLIFIYGVKFSTRKLKSVAGKGGLAAIFSMAAIACLAVPVALILNLKGLEIIIFTLAAALSSSLVGLELIRDDLRKELVHSRLIEAIQLLQDLAAVTAILVLFSGDPINSLASGTILFLTALSYKKGFTVFAENFQDSTEVIMIFSLGTLSGFVFLSQVLNISPIVGAFAAGIGLSRYPYSLEIIDTVGTLKDFFTAILFVSIGVITATSNPVVLVNAAAITLFTLAITPFIIYSTLIATGENDRVSFLTGIGIDQVSEFAVIIAIQAYILNAIPITMLQAVVVATAATMTISSYTTRNKEKIYKIFTKIASSKIELEKTVENPENHIIVIGYDTQGRKIIEEIEDKSNLLIIEYDPEKIDGLKERNIPYIFGDVMHQKPWEEANYKKADLIISTVPLRHVSDRIIELDTDADKILRSPDTRQANQLLKEGATFVSVPKLLSSKRLTEHIRGIYNNPDYKHELRRKNMLNLRKELKEE